MRRPLYIAVFVAVILLPLAVQGQRMGGFQGSSAPRGRMGPAPVSRPGPGFVSRPAPGFVSRPVGRFGPAPAFRGAPAFRAAPGFRSGSRVVANRNGFIVTTNPFFHNKFHSRHFHNRVFFNSCGFNSFDPFFCGSAFGSPFLGGLPFYSYPFYSDYSSYAAPPPQQQPAAVEEPADNRELTAQVQELSDQIQAMRDEQRLREQSRNPAPTSSTQNQETILVFRDGRKIGVRNYAITDGTVWVLDEHTAHKYKLSDFDPAATEQANAQNGVEFRLPTAPEKH